MNPEARAAPERSPHWCLVPLLVAPHGLRTPGVRSVRTAQPSEARLPGGREQCFLLWARRQWGQDASTVQAASGATWCFVPLAPGPTCQRCLTAIVTRENAPHSSRHSLPGPASSCSRDGMHSGVHTRAHGRWERFAGSAGPRHPHIQIVICWQRPPFGYKDRETHTHTLCLLISSFPGKLPPQGG